MKSNFALLLALFTTSCFFAGSDVIRIKGDYRIVRTSTLNEDGETGMLCGLVKDKFLERPQAYANVYLLNTKIGVQADSTGYFQIEVSPGKYVVKVQSLGGNLETRAIKVEKGMKVELLINVGTEVIYESKQ